jgi:CDP-diacylglycerol--glycerol-3-phosphate 3-phosphatidyltransferase
MVRRGFVMPAGRGGKLKTVLQSFAIAGYCLPFELWDGVVPAVLLVVTHVLMAAALVVALVTGVQYVIDARRLAAQPAGDVSR